jgi:hypothetical protein
MSLKKALLLLDAHPKRLVHRAAKAKGKAIVEELSLTSHLPNE